MRRRVANRAAGSVAFEEDFAAFRRFAQLAVDEIRTRNRAQRTQIFVDRASVLFVGVFEENVRKPGADGGFRVGANPGNHRRRRLVREQHTLRVFQVAGAVVEEVPVETVDAGVRMAGNATLPMFETGGRVVIKDFAATARRQRRFRRQTGEGAGNFDAFKRAARFEFDETKGRPGVRIRRGFGGESRERGGFGGGVVRAFGGRIGVFGRFGVGVGGLEQTRRRFERNVRIRVIFERRRQFERRFANRVFKIR